eukprot:127647_1
MNATRSLNDSYAHLFHFTMKLKAIFNETYDSAENPITFNKLSITAQQLDNKLNISFLPIQPVQLNPQIYSSQWKEMPQHYFFHTNYSQFDRHVCSHIFLQTRVSLHCLSIILIYMFYYTTY